MHCQYRYIWHVVSYILLCGVMCFAVISCEKDPGGDPFPGNIHNNRTIRVTMHHVYDSIAFTDSLLPEVEVKIYSSYDQFITDGHADAVRYSDSAGVALFEYRSDDYYWIRCFHSSLGLITDSVSTPPHTVSFVQLYYYF